MPTTSPTPRWRRRSDARPQELLDAALETFVERGYAATNMDEIARRAGVSKGTLYLYYSGKAELLKAVVRQSLLGNLAVVPLIEILQTTIVDSKTNERIAGMVGNNFSSYVRDYDFSILLLEHLKNHPNSAPQGFGDLRGTKLV